MGGIGTGESLISRHESPTIKALTRVHESVELPLGDIVVMPSKHAINALARASYSSDIAALQDNIRLCCQYSVTGCGRIIHLEGDAREQMKHYLVEDTMSILIRTYPNEVNYLKYGDWPALRKNGMFAVVHPLQVMSGVATIEAPLKNGDKLSLAPVVLGGLHDVFEDTEDQSEAMKNVKFRMALGHKEIELVSRRKIQEHLVRLYSEYSEHVANRIAKGLLLVTRGKLPEGMSKTEYYIFQYLKGLYREVFCAKAKGEDFHSNAMAIRDIADEGEMMRLAGNLIPKGLPQVLAWKKDAWVEYHRLLARLEDLLLLFRDDPQYRGIVNEIMAPSAEDLKNFEAGFVVTGSRKFNYRLMATMPPSGSPVLTYYETRQDGKPAGEVEIPFCKNLGQAKDIIQSGFHDVKVDSIMQAPNLIQKRLGSGAVYAFEAKEGWNLENRMAGCKKQYDRMLHDGEMGPALKGFSRPRFADEARRKWGQQISSSSKRLEGFKFYKVQAR